MVSAVAPVGAMSGRARKRGCSPSAPRSPPEPVGPDSGGSTDIR
jgi:hypothetical protein